MRAKFSGYYALTEDEFRALWSACVFAFDTNVLLGLYDASDEYVESFFSMVDRFADRIFLPYQIGLEYQTRRTGQIVNVASKYAGTVKSLEAELAKLSSKRHPFLAAETVRRLNAAVSEAVDELRKMEQVKRDALRNDPIRERLTTLFEQRVGDQHAGADTETVKSIGERRLERKTPPGYMDSSKESNSLGDWFIWHELVEKAKTDHRPIVFVSDDKKEDWWQKNGTEFLGPRPELIQEMMEVAGEQFYMYRTNQFLKHAAQHLNANINTRVLDEGDNETEQVNDIADEKAVKRSGDDASIADILVAVGDMTAKIVAAALDKKFTSSGLYTTHSHTPVVLETNADINASVNPPDVAPAGEALDHAQDVQEDPFGHDSLE